MREWRQSLKEQGERRETPMKPQVVGYELNKLLANDAIVTTDSGTNTSWAARYLDMREDMMFAVSGNLATMACGLPYAMAAALAFPDRQVVAFVGDGGLTMLMGELATCAKYALNVKVVVIKNNSLGQIKWEQIAFLGNPEFGCDLHPIDFAAVARACGVAGYALSDPAQCAAVLREALAYAGPGSDRSHGRSERTSAATESHFRADKKSGGGPRAGNTGCRADRAQHRTRQDSRVDLNSRSWLGPPAEGSHANPPLARALPRDM